MESVKFSNGEANAYELASWTTSYVLLDNQLYAVINEEIIPAVCTMISSLVTV